jgi:predicted phage terminase large subunit-like protein
MLLDNDGTAWLVSTPPKYDVNRNWFTKRFRSAGDEEDWTAFRFTSHDNPHLSEKALARITKDMTKQAYKREIMAQFVEPEGALWSWSTIQRGTAPETLDRVVVGVDPAGGGPEEVGIVVVGKAGDRAYVLDDASMKGSPNEWASAVVSAYRRNAADRVVAEKNYGGDMVQSTLRTADANLPVDVISASRGKQQRAEPCAALYEQGKVLHVGEHDRLEDQMTTWDPQESSESPDRVDALVWALTELMLTRKGPASVSAASVQL